MRKIVPFCFLFLFSIVSFGQGTKNWTDWTTVYEEGGKRVQISFKLSDCMTMGGEQMLAGYSYFRTNNEFNREKCWVNFKFGYITCDGKSKSESVTVQLGKTGIDDPIGYWFTGYKVTQSHFSVEYKDYGCGNEARPRKEENRIDQQENSNLKEEAERKAAIEVKEKKRMEDEEKHRQQADALKQRINSSIENQERLDESKDQLINNTVSLMTTDEIAEFFDKLGYGMNFGGGLSFVSVPLVENTSSISSSNYSNNSSSNSSMPLGLYVNTEAWIVRNQYFGLGGDGYLNLGYYTPTAGASATALMYTYNIHLQGGIRKFKLHFQLGHETRSGTTSNDTDVVLASSGLSSNTGIVSEGSFDYSTLRYGLGALWDFSNETDGDQFIRYTLLFDRPDFLPETYSAIKVHKLWLRYFLDIIVYYGNNYPIAGIPKYKFDTNDYNKSFFMVSISKTFTLFKGNYKK